MITPALHHLACGGGALVGAASYLWPHESKIADNRRRRDDQVMKVPWVPSVRPTVRSALYVAVVASAATVGFAEQSPWPILFAAMLAVPASIAAVPCYYISYGFLALIPGANPSSSSGSVTTAPDGRTLISVSTGMPAAWFTITTFVLGTLALTVAALVNVLLFRALAARRAAQ